MTTFLAACRLPLRFAAWGPLLQVRALTRVASRASEDELLVFALRSTAAHVAERCRELRCGSEDSIDCAARAYAKRSLRVRRDPHRSEGPAKSFKGDGQ